MFFESTTHRSNVFETKTGQSGCLRFSKTCWLTCKMIGVVPDKWRYVL